MKVVDQAMNVIDDNNNSRALVVCQCIAQCNKLEGTINQ